MSGSTGSSSRLMGGIMILRSNVLGDGLYVSIRCSFRTRFVGSQRQGGQQQK